MSLHLRPETQAKLEEIAGRHGVSADDFVKALVKREVLMEAVDISPEQAASGMVEENGILVYRTGNPLPVSIVDEAIRRSREECSLHLLGHLL